MAAIAYPTGLPAPHRWAAVPRERRASSTLPGNASHRPRTRDALQDIEATWFYSAAEMAAWVAWYDTTLLYGQRWFAMRAPGVGGFADRVLRFRTGSVRREAFPRGNFRVSAQVEQRGISAPPLLGFASYGVNIDLNAVTNGGSNGASVGVPVTGLDSAGVYEVRYRSGGTYVAWSTWLNDATAAFFGAPPWRAWLSVSDAAGNDIAYEQGGGAAATAAAAAATFVPFTVTGHAMFFFYITDLIDSSDNRGGLSLSLVRIG